MTRHTARELRDLDALANFQSTREEALTVTCPLCAQPPGELCVRPDGLVHPAPAHWQRIAAATKPAPADPAQGGNP